MKKKVLAALLAVGMVAVLAAGCNAGEVSKSSGDSSGNAETAAAKKGKNLTFVIVPKVVHAWFDEVNKGARVQADALSDQLGAEVKIDYRAPQKADVAEQNSTLEQAAATKPDGIALDPVDYEGSKAVIEEAGKTDQIKFVAMDNLLEILDYVKTGTITAASSTIPQMQGSMSVLMLWQASIGIDIPQKVDTGIAYIDQKNIDEWINTVSK